MKTLDNYKEFLSFSLEDFRKYQLNHLIKFVEKLRTNSKYYQEILEKLPKVKDYSDFEEIPLLNQEILRNSDIDELLAASWDDLASITRSSGSTGRSKVVLWTKESLEKEIEWGTLGFLLEEMDSRSRLAVLMPFEMTRISFTIDICRELGAFIIPIGRIRDNADVDNAIHYLKITKATHVLGSPARLETIADRIRQMGMDVVKDFAVTHLLVGGALLSTAMRVKLEQKWNAKVFQQAGANELSLIGTECISQDGLHLMPGMHYVEILGEETHQPLASGSSGEIVVTQFTNLGTPLLRYRLGDRGSIKTEKCRCGLEFPRLFIEGRIDGTIAIGGTKVHAFQIENVLAQFSQISQFYQAQIIGNSNKTKILLVIEANVINNESSEMLKSDIVRTIINDPMVVYEINDKIKNGQISFEVEFVKLGALERSSGDKVKNQYWDKRNL